MSKIVNPRCEGQDRGACSGANSEVRLLPYGGDGNMILCRACWRDQMDYRMDANRELGRDRYETPRWEDLKVYDPS